MAPLTNAQRAALSRSDYVFPEKAPGPCSLPIPDRAHATAAKRLCSNCGPGACAKVAAFIARRFGTS